MAVVVGPLMSCCGAAVSRNRPHAPLLAVTAPSLMLIAEAAFFLWERRVWLWNLRAEPHRLADLGIAVGFVALALWLPTVLGQQRAHLSTIYSLAIAGGAATAAAFTVIYRWMLLS